MGEIPIAFVVERILAVSLADRGLGGIQLREVVLDTSWVKDYDALEGEGPTRWLQRFDTSNWGLLAAYSEEDDRVGGAVIAFNTAGVHMLEGAADVAVLWVLRVRPDWRGRGVATALFTAAADWCTRRACRTLKVETQNVNVPACRFYAHTGCFLGAIDRRAYPDLPEETMLLWFKDLQR